MWVSGFAREIFMRGWRQVWVLVAAVAGCRVPATAPPPREVTPSVARKSPDLPLTQPTPPQLDGRGLPRPEPRTATGPPGHSFRRLREAECLRLAAANSAPADALGEENRVPSAPGDCDAATDQLRRTLRYHAALELRNRAAADALDRFFQLADAEARADLLRQSLPIADDLHDRARRAKAAGVRFPLAPADVQRRRSELASQLDRAELGSRLLDVDLKRRVGLPYEPAGQRLWPAGDFAIDPTPADPAEAANAALADRPELRGLRALYHGLTVETLPDARDYLKAANSLLGGGRPPLPLRRLNRVLARRDTGPTAEQVAELEVRRKQLLNLVTAREREVADEARAAALALNAQAERVAAARDRLRVREEELAEAVKKREANQRGAELEEAQARLDVLAARGEVAAEVAAWHQARVKLRAAQGWLAWEAVPK